MKLKLSQRFVSGWLLGTALFVMGWAMYLAYVNQKPTWMFVGMSAGMVMLHLYAKTRGVNVKETELFFWAFLSTLIIIAINMSLASLGICEDTFGLLNH